MTKLKKPLLFALSILPIAAIAGYFVVLNQLDTYTDEMLAMVVSELGSTDLLLVIGVVQSVIYACVCGFFGTLLAEKIGLWKPIRFDGRSLFVTGAVSLAGGIVLSLDHWGAGSVIEGIQSANLASLTLQGVLASVLYGGIIEEVLLRLFFLTLLAFVLLKVFAGSYNRDNVPAWIFVCANILAAFVFAAGHLPAAAAIFGTLTPLLLFRCFLLNGGFGLVFGFFYRKYGIIFAMLGHALCHIVSKLIWFIFA